MTSPIGKLVRHIEHGWVGKIAGYGHDIPSFSFMVIWNRESGGGASLQPAERLEWVDAT